MWGRLDLDEVRRPVWKPRTPTCACGCRGLEGQARGCCARGSRVWLLVGLVLSGCSPADGPGTDTVVVSDSSGIPVYRLETLPAWDDKQWQWGLELERAVYTGGDEPATRPLLFQPQGYTRLEDGALVVLDGWEQRLAVVSPNAPVVLARFAPSGQGPGEILSANSVLWPASSSSFWVLDPGNRRISRFNVWGELLEERAVDLPGSGGISLQDPIRHLPHFWKIFRDEADPRVLQDSVGRLDQARGVVSYIAALPPRVSSRRMSTSERVLFAPKAWFAPLGIGGIVMARNDRARFHHYSDDGDLRGIIEVSAEVEPIPLADEQGILEEFLGVAGGGTPSRPEVAEHYPLWDIMWPLGDSLFAVQQNHRSAIAGELAIPESSVVWRLFTVHGEYRGAITFPDGFAQPYWIERDRLVGTRRDDFGVATIEAYRLQPPPVVGGAASGARGASLWHSGQARR